MRVCPVVIILADTGELGELCRPSDKIENDFSDIMLICYVPGAARRQMLGRLAEGLWSEAEFMQLTVLVIRSPQRADGGDGFGGFWLTNDGRLRLHRARLPLSRHLGTESYQDSSSNDQFVTSARSNQATACVCTKLASSSPAAHLWPSRVVLNTIPLAPATQVNTGLTRNGFSLQPFDALRGVH